MLIWKEILRSRLNLNNKNKNIEKYRKKKEKVLKKSEFAPDATSSVFGDLLECVLVK